MPKKSATVRGGQRTNKPKTQKGFELVRPLADEQEEPETQSIAEQSAAQASTATAVTTQVSTGKATGADTVDTVAGSVPKGSASSRLADRRRTQVRSAVGLVTAEHYAYVRKDLIFIAILAIILFAAIIVLRFVPGIGF